MCDLFLLLLRSRRGGLGLVTENRARQRRPTSLSTRRLLNQEHVQSDPRPRKRSRRRRRSKNPGSEVTRASVARQLLSTVELLGQRQAEKVGDELIADYLALDWLEWDAALFASR